MVDAKILTVHVTSYFTRYAEAMRSVRQMCLCTVQYEGGEPCSVCGHRLVTPDTTSPKASALPSNILPQFLYLGSYDNASRSELLKTVGITHILNVSS